MLQEYVGMHDKTKVLTKNRYEDVPELDELRETELSMEEYKVFRMIAARFNFIAQDNPWLQFPSKGGLQEHSQAESRCLYED